MPVYKKKYRVTKRFSLDFEIFVQARNEDEAAVEADSLELNCWNEFDSSWEAREISQISHLALVEHTNEPEVARPVIKIWERTQAHGM